MIEVFFATISSAFWEKICSGATTKKLSLSAVIRCSWSSTAHLTRPFRCRKCFCYLATTSTGSVTSRVRSISATCHETDLDIASFSVGVSTGCKQNFGPSWRIFLCSSGTLLFPRKITLALLALTFSRVSNVGLMLFHIHSPSSPEVLFQSRYTRLYDLFAPCDVQATR